MVAATARIRHRVGRASPLHGHEEGDARRPRSVVHGGSGGRGEAGGSGRGGAGRPCRGDCTGRLESMHDRGMDGSGGQYTGASAARIHRNQSLSEEREHTTFKDRTNRYTDENGEPTQGKHTPFKDMTNRYTDENGEPAQGGMQNGAASLVDGVSPSRIIQMRSLHHASESTSSELTPVTNKTSEQMGVLGSSQLSGENNTFKDRTKIYNYDNPELAQGSIQKGQTCSENNASSFMDRVSPSLMQMRGQDNASEYPLAELTPVRDQTNSCADTNSSVTKQSWYGRLSAEKKQEYLLKQRRYRQLKKISPLNFGSLEEPKHLPEQGTACSHEIAASFEHGVSPSPTHTESGTNRARQTPNIARRKMLTPDERDVMNAQRRADRQELTIDQRNASQRARRQRDRTTLLAKRNAKALAKRKTPCAESIAMMCPLGVSSISTYPAVPNTSPAMDADNAMDADDSPHSSPSNSHT